MASRFRAAVDGGSRGNPGPAAWGVAILDQDDSYVEGHAGAVGLATNNVAEYRGLLEALKLAEQRGAERVEILADSELIVRQINGSYKVKHPDLIPLHSEAIRRIKGFRSFRITHVRRRKNREADRLVKAALKQAVAAGEPVRIHETPETSSAGRG